MASSQFSIAIHTLGLLATAGDKPLKSEAVACLVKTNPVVIRRLLSELSRANLVVSQAGASGGTRLAREPKDILMVDVYRAVADGAVFTLHRKSPNQHCEIGRSIEVVLLQIQNKLDKAIEESLGKITLAEVLRMIAEENESCKARMKDKESE